LALGRQLGLGPKDLATLESGGYLHDVGKIAIPDAILLKPSPLTSGEFDLMAQHTVIGERLCADLHSLGPVQAIVRHHHERLDGSGYPDGLRGDAVPLLAQIVSIADAFDAVLTDRPYRAALTREHAFDELRRDVSQGFRRSDLVEAFIDLGPGPAGPDGDPSRTTVHDAGNTREADHV
jgi:putative two-component system response regulator